MRLQRRTITVASVGAAAVLAVGLTAGAASATGSTAPAKTTVSQLASVTKAAPDTDNVQQGDQTTPDVPGTEKAGTEKAGNEKAGNEKAGNEKPGSEAPGKSDGPGGHADAPGTVDHQFQGQE
jgi:hypothetical protein